MKAWWEGLDSDDQVLLAIVVIPVVTLLIIVTPATAVCLGFFTLMAFMHHTDSKRPSVADRYFDELKRKHKGERDP